LAAYGIGQTVSFSAGATGGIGAITYSWSFGDSSTGTGANPTHVYSAASTYTVSVTATDSLGYSITTSLSVVVAGPIVGTGPDSTGTGFSDSFLAGTGYVPTSPITAGQIQSLTITKRSIKLNFTQSGKDGISLSGTVQIPGGFVVANQKAYYDIGGIMGHFTLGSKGASTPKGNNAFTLKVKSSKGVVVAQTAAFSMTFKNGSFAATLATDGFTKGASSSSTTSKVTLPITLIFNNTVMQTNPSLTYKSSSKSGSAK